MKIKKNKTNSVQKIYLPSYLVVVVHLNVFQAFTLMQ